MSKPKQVKCLITVFDDGTVHIQENHTATTVDIPESAPNDDSTTDDGGDTPTKPPGNP